MQCKVCRCELRILQSRTETDSAGNQWRVLDYACGARQCPEYGKIQEEERVAAQADENL